MHWQRLGNKNNTQTIHFEQLYTNAGIAFLYGGQLVNDKNGRINTTGAYGRFSAVINDDLDWGGLSIGLNLGLVQYRQKLDDVRARHEDDPLTMAMDPVLYPDLGLGAYFYKVGGLDGNDIIHVGLSIPQLFKLDEEKKEDYIYLSRNSHFYLNTGYILTGNDDYSYMELATQIYYVKQAPLFFGVNLKYQFEDVFWLGIGYASNGSIRPEGGISFGESKIFKIGFATDIPLNAYGPGFGNSYELNVLYAFGK